MRCEHCMGEATTEVEVAGSIYHYCDRCIGELRDYIELRFNRGLE